MARKTKQTGQSPGTDAENDGVPSTPQDPNVGSPSAQAFAAKAKDLDALREAVVDAAGVGAGLWLSYLFLFFYLFIAVAAVTHRDFLFQSPVKLPFLDVELPLLGFFVLGPLLFLVLHAYVLLHFAMLAGKVGFFHDERPWNGPRCMTCWSRAMWISSLASPQACAASGREFTEGSASGR